MALYATLADARIENKASGTTDDPQLLRYLRQISRRIDQMFRVDGWPVRPIFEPYIETRVYPLDSRSINSILRTFMLPSSLLALTGVTVATEALAVGTLVEAWPDNASPIPNLRLIECCNGWFSFDCGTCNEPTLIQITGTWGIHYDYANAWQKVDDLTAAVSTTTQATITVADVDGVDIYGLTPRISAGHLLKINSEFMEVISTDISAQTATVRRGVNGSTAATHAIGDDVYVWMVEEPVKREVARQAGMLNARRGAYSTVDITALGEVRYPADLLTSLRAVLGMYAYVN